MIVIELLSAFQQKVVPEEYLKEHLGFYSKIGFFLPTMQGLGVCSVALIYYLADQQNQLLTIYDKTIGKGLVSANVSETFWVFF